MLTGVIAWISEILMSYVQVDLPSLHIIVKHEHTVLDIFPFNLLQRGYESSPIC